MDDSTPRPARRTAPARPITSGRRASPPVRSGPHAAADRGVSDEALEISQLIVELIHVAYATRGVDASSSIPASAPTSGADGLPGGGPAAGGSDGPVERIEAGGRATVSPHAVRAAIHVYRHGGRTIGELADGLGISLGWASRVVHELETSGMVMRAADPADRRIVHVTLTADALDMVRRAYLWRAEAIDRALDALDPAGRRSVQAFLRGVVRELGQAGREVQRRSAR